MSRRRLLVRPSDITVYTAHDAPALLVVFVLSTPIAYNAFVSPPGYTGSAYVACTEVSPPLFHLTALCIVT